MGAAGRKAKVRNDVLVLKYGFGFGFLCTYTQWPFWIYFFQYYNSIEHFELIWLANPMTVWAEIVEINKNGGWELFGWQPTGFILWTFWVLEWLVISFGTFCGLFFMLGESENIFCESCNRWAEKVFTSPPLKPIEDNDHLRSELEMGDFSVLETLYPQPGEARINPEGPDTSFTRLKVMACKQCDNLHVLDVIEISVTEDEDGDVEQKEKVVINNLLVESRFTHGLKEKFASRKKPKREKRENS